MAGECKWLFSESTVELLSCLADSISGCCFGDRCQFLHYVPGGINVVTQLLGSNPPLPAAPRHPVVPPFCNKFNTADGCKYGKKCFFLHSEHELGRPTMPFHRSLHAMGQIPGRYGRGRTEPIPPNLGAAASFGTSATVKISIDASMAGAIIGPAGAICGQIRCLTGVKLSINDHESDPKLKNVELEGTFDQTRQASQMIHQQIIHVSASSVGHMKNPASSGNAPGSKYKTKLCENFAKGPCTFGDRCHFAHGAEELRKPEVPVPELPVQVPVTELPVQVPVQVSLPELPVRELPLPEVPVPELPVPELLVPELPGPELPGPELLVPELLVPELLVPELPVPELLVPEWPVPELLVPQLPVPQLLVPQLPVPELPVPQLLVPEWPVPESPVPELLVPELPVPESPATELVVPELPEAEM
ncbi:Zinc finger CCCH domain-containing protein 31 [Sesamum alatum]|uniref:Zinc finger CCCH domain-containing protein 31 n=1 Tax=Sesamum alatum TaxID=300844 RepID=A0AAE1XWX9_9LAMI|nr:Zinc finger CCCH domain-containing protein 31 [Sesamum alatum]